MIQMMMAITMIVKQSDTLVKIQLTEMKLKSYIKIFKIF